MNVIKLKQKILAWSLFSISLLLITSCDNQINKEKENTYQILSILTHKLMEDIILLPSFPPPPPNGKGYLYTTEDSLKVYKHYYNESRQLKIVALNPYFKPYGKEEIKLGSNCHINESLISKFTSLKGVKKIDINKIKFYKKDSLISYTEEHKKSERKGFEEIDLLFDFSRIAFNKEHTEAIIVAGVSYGKLNGFSTMYFLEKKNEKWSIKCKKGLTIS